MADALLSKINSNKYPILGCCASIFQFLSQILSSNEDSLSFYRIFPHVLSRIIGNAEFCGYIEEAKTREDRSALLSLLSPNGPLFEVLLSLRANPNLKYRLLVDMLPSHIKNALQSGEFHLLPAVLQSRLLNYSSDLSISSPRIGSFNNSKGVLNNQNQGSSNQFIMLDPFEFYLFCFVQHAVIVDKDSALSLTAEGEMARIFSSSSLPSSSSLSSSSIYLTLLRDYFSFFFPLVESVPLGKSQYGGSSQLKRQTVSILSVLDANTGYEMSEFLINIISILWLEQNQLELKSDNFTPSSKGSFYCPRSDMLSAIRVLIGHISLFEFQRMKPFSFSGASNVSAGLMFSYSAKMGASSDSIDFTTAVLNLQCFVYKSIQFPLYRFLRLSFTYCPFDLGFSILVDIWLSIAFPWRQGAQNLKGKLENWAEFILDNFLLYETLFLTFLVRSLQKLDSDLSSNSAVNLLITSKNSELTLISHVLGNFNSSPLLIALLGSVESLILPSLLSFPFQSNVISSPLTSKVSLFTSTGANGRRERSLSPSRSENGGESPRKKGEYYSRIANALASKYFAYIEQNIMNMEPSNFASKPVFSSEHSDSPALDAAVKIIGVLNYLVSLITDQEVEAKESSFISSMFNSSPSKPTSPAIIRSFDEICESLENLFKINESELELMLSSMPEISKLRQRTLKQSIYAETDLNTRVLTEKGKEQIKSGSRRFDVRKVTAINHADELIIKSYENPYLARILFEWSIALDRAYARWISSSKWAKYVIPSRMRRFHFPLRFFASYINVARIVIWGLISYLFLKLIFL